MKLPRPAIFMLGAMSALIVGGTAYAANGGSVLIGRVNQGTALTRLGNSNGTALALNSKSGTPSLSVNRTNKVANLNADLIDGVDSAALALKAGKTGLIFGDDTDSDGTAATAVCPSGTYATGGGGIAGDPADYLWYSGPIINQDNSLVPNSWMALADGASAAWVVCYNPRGAVPGAVTGLSAPSAAAPIAAAHRRLAK